MENEIVYQLEETNGSGDQERIVELIFIMNQILQEVEGNGEMSDTFIYEKDDEEDYDDIPNLVSVSDEDENKDDLVETDDEGEYDDMPELISDSTIEMDDTMVIDIHMDGNQILMYYR